MVEEMTDKVPLKALRGVGTRLRGVGDEFYSSDLPTYLFSSVSLWEVHAPCEPE